MSARRVRAAMRATRGMHGAARVVMSAALALACEERPRAAPAPASSEEPSPNASILPAPLAPVPVKGQQRPRASAEASADTATPLPPSSIRDDERLAADLDLHASASLSLEARFRWLEAPPPRLPDANAEALTRARDKASFALDITVSPAGRLRWVLLGGAFAVPGDSEIRARADRYGHVLVWQNGRFYTPLAPGTLRALFADGRLDVLPLAELARKALPAGNWLGFTTRRDSLESTLGRLDLEQGVAPTAGLGGALLCRMLIELVAAHPSSELCAAELVPLKAEYTWASGGRFAFEVSRVLKRGDVPAESFATPPLAAEVRVGELPSRPSAPILNDVELESFRTRSAAPAKSDPQAPRSGLVVVNHAEGPRYVVLDGVPITWLPTPAEQALPSLRGGRYTLQLKDFFNSESTPPRTLELPARLVIGEDGEPRSK